MFRTHVDTPFYLYVIIFEDVNIQRSMNARQGIHSLHFFGNILCFFCTNRNYMYSGSGEKCVGTVPNTWHSAIKQPPEIFFIKRYSMKFRKIHKKTPAPESLFLKFQAKACNFIKKETLAQVFPVNFAKFLRKLFYIENL